MALRLSTEQRSTTGLLIAMVAVWGLAAVTAPLFPDEVYYWEWSRHLAAGYFDHPPAIAWLIHGGTALFGQSTLGIRAMPIGCGLLTAVAVARMAGRLAGPDAGPRSILLLLVLPLISGAFVLATPDAPLLATTSWSLYAVLRATEEPERGRAFRWWALAGVLLGLAGLSKYIAILVPLGLAAAFLLHAPLRRQLATPGPWVAALLALVIVAPVVVWNAGHGWVSFRFQLAHGLRPSGGGGVLGRGLELVVGQLLLATPILLAFLAAAVWRTLRQRADVRAVPLAAVSLGIAAFFAMSATRQRVEANWLAAAYPPAVVLLAGWKLGRIGTRWLTGGAALAGALTAALIVHVATPLLPLRHEPGAVSQAFGWEAVARGVEGAVASWDGPGSLHLAANRYQEAAALSFLLPGHPPVFALDVASRANQYGLWDGFADVACPGDGMLLVLRADGGEAEVVLRQLGPRFSEVQQGALVERRMPALHGEGALVSRSRIWVLRGWKGTWLPVVDPVPGAPPVSSPAAVTARCRS